jgi:hypothetical protein
VFFHVIFETEVKIGVELSKGVLTISMDHCFDIDRPTPSPLLFCLIIAFLPRTDLTNQRTIHDYAHFASALRAQGGPKGMTDTPPFLAGQVSFL